MLSNHDYDEMITVTGAMVDQKLFELGLLKNEYAQVLSQICLHSKSSKEESELTNNQLKQWFDDQYWLMVELRDDEDLLEQYSRIQKEIRVYEKKIPLNIERLNLLELQSYPAGERTATAVGKVVLALLIGGSTAITFVIVGTALHLAIVAGLAFGAFAYAAKAIRDVYKVNQEERKLTKDLVVKMHDVDILFGDAGSFTRCLLEPTFDMAMSGKLLSGRMADGKTQHSQTETLHKKLVKVYDDVQIAYPGPDQQVDLKKNLSNKISQLEVMDPALMEKRAHIRTISHRAPHQSSGPILWTLAKKAGNRTLCFMGGAAAAVSVGVGIAIVVFGISNPAGWVMLGILAGAAIVGAAAVGVDYYASRRQDTKIRALKDKAADFVTIKKTVDEAAIEINKIYGVAMEHHKQMNEKDLALQQERKQHEQDKQALLTENKALSARLHEAELAGLMRANQQLMEGAKSQDLQPRVDMVNQNHVSDDVDPKVHNEQRMDNGSGNASGCTSKQINAV